LVAEGRATLVAGGSVTLLLPPAGNPKSLAVKVMTWSSQGMRYGHFPLELLGVVALQRHRNSLPTSGGWRMAMQGSQLILVGQGRRIGLDGKAMH
jgi:hypothetical protein